MNHKTVFLTLAGALFFGGRLVVAQDIDQEPPLPWDESEVNGTLSGALSELSRLSEVSEPLDPIAPSELSRPATLTAIESATKNPPPVTQTAPTETLRAQILTLDRVTRAQIQYAENLNLLMSEVSALAPFWPILEGTVDGPLADLMLSTFAVIHADEIAANIPPPVIPESTEKGPRRDVRSTVIAISCGSPGRTSPFILIKPAGSPAHVVDLHGTFRHDDDLWRVDDITRQAGEKLVAVIASDDQMYQITDTVGEYQARGCSQ